MKKTAEPTPGKVYRCLEWNKSALKTFCSLKIPEKRPLYPQTFCCCLKMKNTPEAERKAGLSKKEETDELQPFKFKVRKTELGLLPSL